MGKRLAKGLAALQCVQALHIDGELDDHLQPKVAANWSRGITAGGCNTVGSGKHPTEDPSTIAIEVKVVADALFIEPAWEEEFRHMYLYTTRVRPNDIEENSFLESCPGIRNST